MADNGELKTFEFIKAISETFLDMINAAYREKHLMYIGASFREKLVSHHQAASEADAHLLLRSVGSKPRHQQRYRTYWIIILAVCGQIVRDLKR